MIVCDSVASIFAFKRALSNDIYFFPAGVTVDIEEVSYSVGESDSSVTICAVLTSGETAIPVSVILMTESGGQRNAQGIIIIRLLVSLLLVAISCVNELSLYSR